MRVLKKMLLPYFGLAFFCSLSTALTSKDSLQNDRLSTFMSDWPVGDPRRCQEQATQDNLNFSRFEVLPGLGWDNLRNLESGQVVVYNYSLCRLTNDGKFLIPDSVFTVPLKTSEAETFAELIDHWQNTSSLTSASINLEAGLDFKAVSISGKFSREHEQLKSKQVEDKAVTVRVQLRYNRYEVKLQPDPTLSPQFKSRLLSIAARVELNQTEQARYEAQLVTRYFGTHVVTSVTAGAALVQEDYLTREFVSAHSEDKTAILASASASFFKVFSVGGGYSRKTDDKIDTMYNNSLTHSYMKSFGGPLVLGTKRNLSQWASGVDENLVAVDRSGDPLYFLITPTTLPELPATTVAEVQKLIRESTQTYYQMNTIPGCTQLGSLKFSVSANFDDGTCTARPTNNTFGGIYQTCSVSGRYLTKNPCDGLDEVNPKTGQHSCPPSYRVVRLHAASKQGQPESENRCHSCGLFHLFKCCHTDQYVATANYQTYWCAATGPVEQESGYRFGGVYTSATENLVTQDKGCPPGYYVRKMFTDLNVCISDDFELDTAYSVPFGGFYSCTTGNPLALPGVHPVGAEGDQKLKEAPNSLKSFMASNSGPGTWPQRCPEGYSQHLATLDVGCAIYFCVESGALSGPTLPPVKRPPFVSKPPTLLETADNIVMFDMETQTWAKNQKARDFLSHMQSVGNDPPQSGLGKDDGNSGLSAGAASGISIACTLALVGLTTLAVMGYRRRRDRRPGGVYRPLHPGQERQVLGASESHVQADYGTVNIDAQV